jgi:hypothetical protein
LSVAASKAAQKVVPAPKMTGQKRMTTISAFNFQTALRAKYLKDMDYSEQDGVPEEYIPLWKQVQMSF